MKKVVCVFAMMVLAVVSVFGVIIIKTDATDNTADLSATSVKENEKALYPKDDRELVKSDYMIEILQKKSSREKLDAEIENLISYFKIQSNGYGIAWVDVHSVGMHKMTSRLFETSDGGENWNVLKSEYFIPSGDYSCAYIDDTVIISKYSSVSETPSFEISHDRGHSFEDVTASKVLKTKSDVKQLIPVKLYEDDKKQSIVYGWLNGDIASDKYRSYILIAEYDKNLNVLKEYVPDSSGLT